MKKIYYLITAILLMFSSSMQLNAQCSGNRYHDAIFPSAPTVTSNIQYGSNLKSNGSNQNLLLDVYQPTGDIATGRALIIIAHGGSFIGGTKTGTDVVPLCNDLAKMGYVVASIEYRVGMTHFPFPGPDSVDAGSAVMRGVQDGRAAVRFFRKNVAVNGNTYKIDTNNIYFAGSSAGGFIALHVAYMDQASEFPAYVDTVGQSGLHGGIEGLSGNPGYSSKVKAIVNICGALGNTAWMHTGDTPVLSLHGTNDNTVPYGSAVITLSGLYPLLTVHGSSSITARANQVGITNCFHTYWGQGHVPHSNNAAHYDTTLVITRNFLEHFTCGVPLNCNYNPVVTSVADFENEATISVFPNPANTSVTIDLSALTGNVVNFELYDAIGKKVKNISAVKTDLYTITRDNLPNGIYFMNVVVNGKLFSKKIMFE